MKSEQQVWTRMCSACRREPASEDSSECHRCRHDADRLQRDQLSLLDLLDEEEEKE